MCVYHNNGQVCPREYRRKRERELEINKSPLGRPRQKKKNKTIYILHTRSAEQGYRAGLLFFMGSRRHNSLRVSFFIFTRYFLFFYLFFFIVIVSCFLFHPRLWQIGVPKRMHNRFSGTCATSRRRLWRRHTVNVIRSACPCKTQ